MTPLDVQPVTLEGRAVRLEPLAEVHAEDLAAVADSAIFQFTFPPKELTPDGFRAQIRDYRARANFLAFAVIEKATGQAVGVTTYMDIRPAQRGLEIGSTWLASRVQGSAVNPECKFLLLRHAFEVLGTIRVQLKTDSRNLQSQRAIEKLGAQLEGVLRRHMILASGYLRDTVMYSIIEGEWPNVKAGLIARLGYEP